MIHDLKSWPANFHRLAGGCTAEVRQNDRNYAIADLVHIREYLPAAGEFTPRTLDYRIKYILTSTETPGLQPGYVVLIYSALITAAAQPPPAVTPAIQETISEEHWGWICDRNPVFQMVEDARGERHQLMGPEMNDHAAVGATGKLLFYHSGRREFQMAGCRHLIVGEACVTCGLPKSLA